MDEITKSAKAVHPVLIAGVLVGLATAFIVLIASGAIPQPRPSAADHSARIDGKFPAW